MIFLSYRRRDTLAATGRIYDRLIKKFSRDEVFWDIATIPIAAEFPRHIVETIKNSSAFVAIVGANWAGQEPHVNSRVDKVELVVPMVPDIARENDFVRIELEAAQNANVPMFPVFIDGAKPPNAAILPPEARALFERNGRNVSNGQTFDHDIEVLANHIQNAMSPRHMQLKEILIRISEDIANSRPLRDPVSADLRKAIEIEADRVSVQLRTAGDLNSIYFLGIERGMYKYRAHYLKASYNWWISLPDHEVEVQGLYVDI